MSDFAKKFLQDDARRLGPGGRYVGLAAFGKHPGWDDHVEDLGLETASLNIAKKILYVEGIGGQIDSGAWAKLDATQQLPAFRHLFLWQRSGQILLGRLWSSSDGKGRKLYPLVVCLHFTGVTLGWALRHGLPELADLEQGIINTSSAEDVRQLLARRRAALRAALQSVEGGGEYAPLQPEALHRFLHPDGGPYPEAFFRVLYQIDSQLGFISSGAPKTRSLSGANRAQQIRVPAGGATPEESFLFWTRFLLERINSAEPLLFTLPLDAEWLDVTVGEPSSHEFFCLRASPRAVPMASEVPYQLDDAFRARASAFLDGLQGAEAGAAAVPAPEGAPPPAPAPAKSIWRRWLGVGVFLALAAVSLAGRFSNAESRPAASPAPFNFDCIRASR